MGGAPGCGSTNDGGQQRQQQQQPQGRQQARQGGGPPQEEVRAEGNGRGGQQGIEERRQAPQPRNLPPVRLVNMPAAPRRTIARKVEAVSERIDGLQEEGAGEAKLRRARETKEQLTRDLRAAGGATDKALSFFIKMGGRPR